MLYDENSRGTNGILIGNILASNDEFVLVLLRVAQTVVDKLRGVKFFIIIFSHFDNPKFLQSCLAEIEAMLELKDNVGFLS